MNILMTLMGLNIGGAETHVVELSKALKKMGYNIFVASNGGVYEKELIDSGITHIKVPLINKNPLNLFKSYKMLKQIILDYKIDLVHAHARIPGFLCGKLHKKMKFPFVTSAHWVFSTAFPLKHLTDWGQKTIAVSDDIKSYLIENYGVEKKNITVTINGIDTEKFSPHVEYVDILKEFGLEKERRRIVYISRMDASRSLAAHKLINVFEQIRNHHPDVDLIIVGGGDDFENVKRRAEEVNSKLADNPIVLTGSRVDINKFFASAHLVVAVSRSALEGMAAEKATVVAGNEGYIGIFSKENLETAVSTNFCCRGCELVCEENLLKDIMYLLDSANSETLKELEQFSRETVKNLYSIGRMANDAANVYSEFI